LPSVLHQQRTELDGSSMPRNQGKREPGTGEPGTVQVWRALRAMTLAYTRDFKNFLSSIEMFCCEPSPCFGTMPHIVACVCSPRCHHLCIIFHRRLSLLICVQAPASLFACFCTAFSAAPLHIASLTILLSVERRSLLSYLPCLAVRFFPRENCSIRL